MNQSDKTQTAIRAYFKKLGLEAEIADIYLALHSYGPQSISALARNSKVERTRIYRLIDQLNESNLIEIEAHSKRGIIKAAPIANLRILINQRQEELKNLQDELELVEQTLARNSLSSPGMRVQFYHGPEGIRQMLWNELGAKSELLGYSYRLLEETVGKKFMEDWTDEFEERQLKQRLLIHDDTSRLEIKGAEYHHLDPTIYRIGYSCAVYDDVTVYYHWDGNDVYGVETYNQAIADSQRQVFELLWRQSQ